MFHVLYGRSFAGAAGGLWHCRPARTERPLCLGGSCQLVLHYRGGRPLGGLGACGPGSAWTGPVLLFLLGAIPWGGILLYWALYFLWIWLIWLVVAQIEKSVGRWREKPERARR